MVQTIYGTLSTTSPKQKPIIAHPFKRLCWQVVIRKGLSLENELECTFANTNSANENLALKTHGIVDMQIWLISLYSAY